MSQRFTSTILVYDGFAVWALILKIVNDTAAVLTDIVDCTFISLTSEIDVRSEIPHQLSVGDKIKLLNITSDDNIDATDQRGYNGEFKVTRIINSRVFRYSQTDVNGLIRTPGEFTNDINDRNILLPRFIRKDAQVNAFVYRVDEITQFVEGIRDGIYHLFCVNGGNKVSETCTERAYNQPIEDLYPQTDLDNVNDNPTSTILYLKTKGKKRGYIERQESQHSGGIESKLIEWKPSEKKQ